MYSRPMLTLVGQLMGGADPLGATADWTQDFNLPDGTRPSVVLDFANGRYFDGTSNSAALSSLVSGSPTIDANGMLCNSIDFGGIGALLAAFRRRQSLSGQKRTWEPLVVQFVHSSDCRLGIAHCSMTPLCIELLEWLYHPYRAIV